MPAIKYIITNDRLSERSRTLLPVPAGYNKGLVDSLRDSFVEEFDDSNNVSRAKYYNGIGALYRTQINFYDRLNRAVRILEIDEFNNDTCAIRYEYNDSMKINIHKQAFDSCANQRFDFYFKYDDKGAKIEALIYRNGALFNSIFYKNNSGKERQVISYNSKDRLNGKRYTYNGKGLLLYEEVIHPKSFEQLEYKYRFDAYGNWTERICQTRCLPQKNVSAGQTEVLCIPEIREKLIRKIYYK